MPASEAELLSIYFEETSAYQYAQNRKTHSGGGTSRAREITDMEIPDEEEGDE